MKRQVCQLAEQARSSWKDDSFTSWDQWPVETPTRERIETHRKERPNEEIVIGRIDNDGHVLGLFGPLPGLQNIAKEEFVTPYRFPLEVVLIEDKILIRKDFRGRRAPFIREWHNLTLLNAKANVPPVFCVDERRCVLYKNFIPGSTIRARLARAGARILNKQTDQDPELAHLDGQERLYAILARGSALISKCLAPDVVTEMEHQIEAIHRCGVANLSLTFGNLIVDENRVPWFLDFEGARAFPSTHHPLFVLSRDKDRALFNRIYGRNLLTEKSAREA
ncbi:MAG: hypothetical protein GTO12_07440, partial [Proteobacteria bacterium]|nr:hypothetical protein [Pseudomonadota bacterium]